MLCALLAATLWPTMACAGTLTRPQVEAMFPPPLMVGEQLGHLPVWPIFLRAGATLELLNYAFEPSIWSPLPATFYSSTA